jgi:hypothetical protein
MFAQITAGATLNRERPTHVVTNVSVTYQ